MKVYIGPYVEWFGPYQIADHDTWLMSFTTWLHERRKRRVWIKLDDYDHWDTGTTLSLLALPLLKQLKEAKQGSTNVDLSDVPESLWPAQLPGPHNNYVDDTVHDRWAWVMDEMIWAFEQHIDDSAEDKFYTHEDGTKKSLRDIGSIKIDSDGLEEFQLRKQNGFRLFGKYFQALWD
jgi:hypothetical protein